MSRPEDPQGRAVERVRDTVPDVQDELGWEDWLAMKTASMLEATRRARRAAGETREAAP